MTGSYREKGRSLFFALFGHKYVVDGKCREITGFKCGSRIVDGAGHVKINLQKNVDVRKFDKLIASALFSA